jgi:5-hydroxyisourate hydrolase-like protein (transthyretin family)
MRRENGMNKHNIHFSLDLDRQNSQVYVNVRKSETAAKLFVSLTMSGVPYNIADGVQAKLKATLPDGTYKEADCTISEGRIEVPLSADHTTNAGRYRAHFELTDDGTVLPTPFFTVDVDDPAQ